MEIKKPGLRAQKGNTMRIRGRKEWRRIDDAEAAFKAAPNAIRRFDGSVRVRLEGAIVPLPKVADDPQGTKSLQSALVSGAANAAGMFREQSPSGVILLTPEEAEGIKKHLAIMTFGVDETLTDLNLAIKLQYSYIEYGYAEH